jgi:hypothetical protein
MTRGLILYSEWNEHRTEPVFQEDGIKTLQHQDNTATISSLQRESKAIPVPGREGA